VCVIALTERLRAASARQGPGTGTRPGGPRVRSGWRWTAASGGP